MRRNKGEFLDDDRAIEGLPIRLIIALVVGVAALGIMMQVLGTFGGFGDEEVTAQIEEGEVLDLSEIQSGTNDTVELTIITSDGEEVEDATVLLEPGTAQGDILQAEDEDGDGTVTFSMEEANVDLASDQNRGTYEIEILPPSDGDFTDDQSNPEIVILDN